MRSWKAMGAVLMSLVCLVLAGCEAGPVTSDQKQTEAQEQILKDLTAQVGMPSIKNAREKKLAKMIIEMRDQEDLVTYLFLENAMPAVVPGKTCYGGKLTYIGRSIGYALPYATQYTSPQKIEWERGAGQWYRDVMPQADPNGLFAPQSAEGSWVMMADSEGNAKPQYFEPKVCVLTFKPPFD